MLDRVLVSTGTIILALLAGCTTGSPNDDPTPSSSTTHNGPTWSSLGDAGLPLTGSEFAPQIAAGHGYVLLQSDSRLIGLRESPDGGSWRRTSPPGLDLNGPIADLAGSEIGVFLLGTMANKSSPTVWKYADGNWGNPVQIDTTPGNVFDGADKPTGTAVTGAQDWTVAAGAAGVLVASKGPNGLTLWLSSDGTSFSGRQLELKGPDVSSDAPIHASATSNGFIVTIGDHVVTIAADGTPRETTVVGLPPETVINGVAVHGDRMVAFGLSRTKLRPGDPGYDPDVEVIEGNDRYTNGSWCAPVPTDSLTLRPAEVDPGQLPDAGVVARGSHFPITVSEYVDGFLLAGSAAGVGGVWHSSDGCAWTKQPVNANGFDRVSSLVGIASKNEAVLLLGNREGRAGTIDSRLWFSGPGTPPTRTATSPPPPPMPPAGNNGQGAWTGTVRNSSGASHRIVLGLTGPPAVGEVVGGLSVDTGLSTACTAQVILTKADGGLLQYRTSSVQRRDQSIYCPASFSTQLVAGTNDRFAWQDDSGFKGQLLRR
jgi:hypothetical protein